MPLLSGSASLTRLRLVGSAATVDFDAARFTAIDPRSEVRETIGFLPFEPNADYRLSADRWAFRVRIDQRRPDATAIAERLRELLAVERQEHGVQTVPSARRKVLRQLAEEELLADARVQTTVLEGAITARTLHLATSSDNAIGKVMTLLRKVGLLTELQTPWSDLGEGEAESEIMELRDPLRSLHGSAFLKHLVEDEELIFEPHEGYLKLQTRETKVTITGAITRDLHHYLDEGCELLGAKLIAPDLTFKLDALSFRLSGATLGKPRPAHWTERLDERLERIEALWELLDRKYREAKRRPARRRASATPDNVVPFGG